MSNEHDHIDQLTPELIKQYRAGTLSPGMMHAVEKYLLENPFEAEAFEGLALIDNKEVEGHVIDLHERIDELTHQSEVDKGATAFWAYTRRIAAVILLLLMAGYIFIWLKPELQESPMTKELTEKTEDKAKSDSSDRELVNGALRASTPSQNEASDEIKSKPEQEPSAITTEENTTLTVASADVETLTEEQIEAQFEKMEESAAAMQARYEAKEAAFKEEMASQRAAATSRLASVRNTQSANASTTIRYDTVAGGLGLRAVKVEDKVSGQPIYDPNRPEVFSNVLDLRSNLLPDSLNQPINGRVTDAITGLALAGAVVTSGKQNKAVTDDQGYFSLKPDSVSKLLMVSHAGYSSREAYAVGGLKPITFRLSPDREKENGFISSPAPSVQANSTLITGQLLGGDDGLGIPRANITVKGTTLGTITDLDGNFSLSLDTAGQTLVASFIGYESKEIPLGTQKNYIITLESSQADLAEVVVYGYGSQEKKEIKSSLKRANVDRLQQRQRFDDYVKENLIYPEAAKSNDITGKVTLEFKLDKLGNISDIKVVKGIGYGCDEEAIRLLKEGPEWLPARNKKTGEPEASTQRVKIRFRP